MTIDRGAALSWYRLNRDRSRALFEMLPEPADHTVNIRKLAIVESPRKTRPPRGRQQVGPMQIVKVHERKKGRCGMLIDPMARRRFNLVSTNLHLTGISSGKTMQGKLAPVRIEASS